MKRISMFAVAAMFVCGIAVAQPPDCPWRFVTGHWKLTDSTGHEGKVVWKATGGNALIGLWEDENGKGTELAGWRPDKKEFVATGYGAKGEHWEIVCTIVTKDMLKGTMINRTSDGKIGKGTWTLSKEGKNEMTSLFEGTVNGEETTIKGHFVRE